MTPRERQYVDACRSAGIEPELPDYVVLHSNHRQLTDADIKPVLVSNDLHAAEHTEPLIVALSLIASHESKGVIAEALLLATGYPMKDTLQEIGDRYGVSKQYVSKLLTQAKEELKHHRFHRSALRTLKRYSKMDTIERRRTKLKIPSIESNQLNLILPLT
jgi:DNA-binding CsgD family transcriptional regulator